MLRTFLWTSALPASSVFGYRLGEAMSLMRRAETWSRADLDSWQGAALHRLLAHCYAHVPYYADLMRSLKLTPSDFRRASDLAKLPVLTRGTLRAEQHRLRSSVHPDRVCVMARSGGTSGEPVTIALDPRARAHDMAAYVRGFGWMGHTWGAPIVHLFGGSLGLSAPTLRSRAVSLAFNSRSLPAFELRPDTLGRYVNELKNAVGGVLVGYASAVLNLANMLDGAGVSFRLNAIICTAEQMPLAWRRRIESVMGAPVQTYYGCNELGSIGYERQGQEGYFVTEEHAIIEAHSEPLQGFTAAGTGELVITSLFNYAMPIIRYRNGDTASLGLSADGGRQKILTLQGRVMDQLLTSEGVLSGSVLPTHVVLKSGVDVLKYQVVQTRAGQLAFHYETRGDRTIAARDRALLTEVFKRHLGASTEVQFVKGEFELSPAGKHRLVINKAIPRA